MPVCFIIAVVAYLILILWLWRGWIGLPRFAPTDAVYPQVKISVVVPMRNEEQHIGLLLHDIVLQTYPAGLFRVIVVNDHSTDGSVAIADTFAKKHPCVFLLHLSAKQGKKAALQHALPYLSELAVTVDADCRVQPAWLETIARCYEARHPAMIIGPVMITRGQDFFSKCQALEMMSLIGTSAAATAWERPLMCSGANLIMERSIMERYAYIYDSHVLSGDDMMMMLEIKKKYPKRIVYLKTALAVAETAPISGLSGFLRQRNRWVSKSSHYTDRDVIAVALIVFCANLSIVVCLITGFFQVEYLWWALILWLAKTLVDLPFLISLAYFWKRKDLMQVFFPAQLLYPFYVVWTGIAGNIIPVKWKGRTSKSR